MGGEETTVGALIAARGGSIKTGPFGTVLKAHEYTATGVPLISAGEIGYGHFRIQEKTPRVSEQILSRLPEYVLRTGDIVFGRKGAVDRSARISHAQDGWFLGSDGIRLRLAASVDSRFMAYQLQSESVRRWILQHATGTTMASLNQGVIERIPIVLPPPLTQRAIARILGSLDDKIELNRRMNETLEEMARALFKSWFVDFDRTDGEMPAGWSIDTLASACTAAGGEVQTGPFGSQLHASDYIAEGIPVVMPTNIRDRRVVPAGIVKISAVDAERLARHRLLRGDLVYSRRGDVEKHAIVGREEEGWLCGTGCLRVRPSRVGQPSMSSHYLSLWLDQPEQRAWISARAIGATMPNLNTTILGEVPVLLPDSEALAAFDEFMEPLDARIRALRAESETLAELRDLLLPKLISGELRIRDAERAAESVA